MVILFQQYSWPKIKFDIDEFKKTWIFYRKQSNSHLILRSKYENYFDF